MFTYEPIPTRRETGEIRITGCRPGESHLEVPPFLDGKPVTEIGAYAFARMPLASLSLPESVSRIGNYALYQCTELVEFHFYDALQDIGAGAFTGCHHIRRLRIDFTRGERSALRDVLMEIPEELSVEYCTGTQKAQLLFPEFYEEGVENTPARIIEHHTHGSGLLYRNCFVSRVLSFGEYDDRFPYARGQEREELLVRMAAGRLRYPYQLSPKARQAYQTWLMEHFDTALDTYTRLQDQSMTGFLMGLRRNAGAPRRPSFAFD